MTAPAPERVTVRLILADRGVRTVILVAFVMMFGAGLVLPILPLFARSFGVGYGGAGVLISVYAFARLGTDLASGFVVHRAGERRAAIGGLLVLGAGALATGLAPGYWIAVVAWGAAGVGSALVFAALYSEILKLVPADRLARTLSVFYGSFNLAIVAGGFLAGIIAHVLGVAAPLFFTAGTAVLGALLYLVFVPHAGFSQDGQPATRLGMAEIGRLFKRSGFVMVNVTNLAYLWMIAAVVDTLIPLFARDALGMSTVGIGVVLAVLLAAELVVLYPAGSLADRKGRRFVMVPALAALAITTVVVGWTDTVILFGIVLALLGVASGFAGVPPAAMLADVLPRSDYALGVGVFRFAGDLGFTLGPLVAGFVAQIVGFRGSFAVTAVPTLVALVLVMRSAETLQLRTTAK